MRRKNPVYVMVLLCAVIWYFPAVAMGQETNSVEPAVSSEAGHGNPEEVVAATGESAEATASEHGSEGAVESTEGASGHGSESGVHEVSAIDHGPAPAGEVHGAGEAHGEAHGDGHGEGSGGTPWYRSMDLWKFINLSVFFLVLYKLLGVPVSRFLAERSDTIASDLKNAEEEREVSASELKEMQARFESAKTEIEEIMDKGQDDARRLIEDIKENTSREIELLKKRIVDELDQELIDARRELTTFIASNAVKEARVMIEKMDQGQLQNKYLGEFQETLKKQGGNGEGS